MTDTASLPVTSTFEVGNSPVADFEWKSECFEAGQSIEFNDVSTPGFGNITDYRWKIYTSHRL